MKVCLLLFFVVFVLVVGGVYFIWKCYYIMEVLCYIMVLVIVGMVFEIVLVMGILKLCKIVVVGV